MKTTFAVLGIIFLVLILIVLGAVGFGFIAMRENPLDAAGFWFLSKRGAVLNNESKAYADAAIPAIITNWNEKELLDRQSPEFKQSVTQQQLDQSFQRLAGLGRLQKCEPAQGEAMMSAMAHQIKGDYTAKATFEKGETVVVLSLIKHGDEWQILGFFVKPLIQQASPPPPQQQQPTQPQQPR